MLRTLTIVMAGCALLALSMPAQTIDAPGVAVNLGGAAVMHRTSVPYPQNAQSIQGTVTVQVTLDAKGNVTDAHVLSGPVELRRTVLESVLQWHFARSAGASREIGIAFQTPSASATQVVGAPAVTQSVTVLAGQPGVLGSIPAGSDVRVFQSPAPGEQRRLTAIQLSGFNEDLRGELLAALPAHEGDMISTESLPAIQSAVRQYDEHLTVGISFGPTNETTLRIQAPGAVYTAPAASASVNWAGLKVDGSVEAAKVIRRVLPVYPPIARQARIQGHVILNAQIGADGTMQQLVVVSGHPLLQQAAMDAVRQWVYQPTLLNGQPVQVVTQIDVNFTLQE